MAQEETNNRHQWPTVETWRNHSLRRSLTSTSKGSATRHVHNEQKAHYRKERRPSFKMFKQPTTHAIKLFTRKKQGWAIKMRVLHFADTFPAWRDDPPGGCWARVVAKAGGKKCRRKGSHSSQLSPCTSTGGMWRKRQTCSMSCHMILTRLCDAVVHNAMPGWDPFLHREPRPREADDIVRSSLEPGAQSPSRALAASAVKVHSVHTTLVGRYIRSPSDLCRTRLGSTFSNNLEQR